MVEEKSEKKPEEKEEKKQATPAEGSQPDKQAEVDKGKGGVPKKQMAKSGAPEMAPASAGKKRTILIVAVVLVLAIGAVVAGIISGRRARLAKREEEPQAMPTPTIEKDELTTAYQEQSDSDEIEVIEEDLQDTSFDQIDKELSDIDEELSVGE